MLLSLELEIKSLLDEFHEPEVVAEKLVKLFDDHKEEWSEKNVQELCRFMLNCSLYQNLIRFCLKYLPEKRFTLPWPYFIEALTQGLPDLEEDIVKFLVMGIEEEKAQEAVSLAKGGERFVPETKELRLDRKRKRRREASRIKQELMEELLTLRTQQLYDQEKALLGKMQRMFPGDQDIIDEIREHKERYALDILARRSPLSRGHTIEEHEVSPEVAAQTAELVKAIKMAASVYPEMAYDFAIASYMLDEVQASHDILESLELMPHEMWFFLEVKLKCRRFLEVIDELNRLELALATEPETFFATAYLRAQAYWGLDQKHIAIEILENITAARPHYRASSALLDLWRTQ